MKTVASMLRQTIPRRKATDSLDNKLWSALLLFTFSHTHWL